MKRILIAEDQADIRNLLVLNLRSAGYDVTDVVDGLAALASETAQRNDLLILDLMMPGLDGLEVCKTLRARGCNTPILMLTAKSTELDRVLGLGAGGRRLSDQTVFTGRIAGTRQSAASAVGTAQSGASCAVRRDLAAQWRADIAAFKTTSPDE